MLGNDRNKSNESDEGSLVLHSPITEYRGSGAHRNVAQFSPFHGGMLTCFVECQGVEDGTREKGYRRKHK